MSVILWSGHREAEEHLKSFFLGIVPFPSARKGGTEKDYELLFASEKQIFVSLLFPLRVKVPLKYSPASFVPRYATNSPKAIRKIPLDSRCPYSCRSRSRYSPRSRNSRDNKGRPSDKDRNSSAFLWLRDFPQRSSGRDCWSLRRASGRNYLLLWKHS